MIHFAENATRGIMFLQAFIARQKAEASWDAGIYQTRVQIAISGKRLHVSK